MECKQSVAPFFCLMTPATTIINRKREMQKENQNPTPNTPQNNQPESSDNQKPQKGWKSFSRQEKLMVISIAILLILVLVRWDFIRDEAGDAFRTRIDTITGKGMDTLGMPAMRMPTDSIK